jgi:phospholipase C
MNLWAKSLFLAGCFASICFVTTLAPAQISSFQHIIVVVQENRTPDNLFQGLCSPPYGTSSSCSTAPTGSQYNIQTSNWLDKTSSTGTTQPTSVPLANAYDLGHKHSAFTAMCDVTTTGTCKMDGAGTSICAGTCPTHSWFKYVDNSTGVVNPYLNIATQYGWANYMFQTNQGPSFPAHQFIISGTSAPCSQALPCPGPGSNLFASENPNTNGPPDAGCDAPVGSIVRLIDPAGSEVSKNPVYPCFDHQTLTDLLEAKSLTWRYYTPGTAPPPPLHGSPAIWNGPEAIQHICGPNAPPPNATACVGSDWINNVVLDQTQVLTDIANNQLRNVSWVIPSGQASDHPGTDGSGPSWVASVVNAIGNSPYWADTAIFITWDDWGGWFDHVAPPQVLVNCSQWGCGYVYGFRVPLIVISPYVKANFISNQQHDFGSILKFIEVMFSLPSLGNADVPADDFSDCFDFNQTPLKFQTIQAPLNAQYFLNDKTPPTDPDDD